ncbi:amino acid adenylation domain-containing protein [Streptomyces sp. NPDC059255]|uniref:amino acid adenylation domain-containing protein n=1 Tax=Streptomyces sp. NPDC059255 TaxID=3346793 RepID=UPI003682CA8A
MTPPPVPTRLDELLTRAARDHPDRPALAADGRTLTYAELEGTVRRLADALTAAGVRPGDRVGIHVPKSVEAVLAVHAVLRSGAVAAPLDVAVPPERTARMVRNAGITFLIAPSARAATTHLVKECVDDSPAALRLLGSGLGILPVDCPAAPIGHLPGAGYVLFTSGSTGWPKGVLLSHENVLHFVRWAVGQFGVTASDRIGSQSSLTFDLSTFDIFGSALSGACLVLLPDELKGFPRDVVGWLRSERISVFYAVPTLYRSMLRQGGASGAALPELRIIAFAGEPFPVGDLKRYTEVFETAEFYNLYGPTETNVCTFEQVSRRWDHRDGLSIGRAIDGVRVELVDDSHRVTRDEGEIAVVGPTVFLGYLVDGEPRALTTRVSPDDGGGPAYLTGDLGHYGEDGKIYLRGRRDHQVKRRGYRIDLLDIESVVQEFPAVRTCAAVWRPRGPGEGSILLYAVADGTTEAGLREAVSTALPRHMMPDDIHLVDRLALTDRGKIDREALASAVPTQERDHGRRR